MTWPNDMLRQKDEKKYWLMKKNDSNAQNERPNSELISARVVRNVPENGRRAMRLATPSVTDDSLRNRVVFAVTQNHKPIIRIIADHYSCSGTASSIIVKSNTANL